MKDYYAANMMIVDLVIMDDVYDPITINQVLSDLDLEVESPTVVLTQLMGQLQGWDEGCLLYTSPSPRDAHESRMPSSA